MQIVQTEPENHNATSDSFKFVLEQFADLKILRFQVPGFEALTLQQKTLLYFLSEAALCGRDIIFDQNGKYNLLIRKTLETIIESYTGDRNTEEFNSFVVYTKRIWFSNGIYHHYSSDKLMPGFSPEYFKALLKDSDYNRLPPIYHESPEDFFHLILPVMFDPAVLPKKVCQETGKDLVLNSACNFYDGVTEQEAVAYYLKRKQVNDPEPPSYGLNSRLVKEHGQLKEQVWKIGGTYGEALQQVVNWLEKACEVAENQQQTDAIHKLISFYRTGDLKTFDSYNISWLHDTESRIDFVNGFIENYGDPLGIKATWESVVNFKNIEATRRTEIISSNAQWFEDHSPVGEQFRKKQVKGISAKVITVAQLGGDCYPSTPIGINLPNADWIRKEHGSKSVTMENITYAYHQASLGTGFLEEFCSSEEELRMIKIYGFQADNLHTDLHECLGHGSGQLLPGTDPDALRNYGSALEESRADLYALYYMMDPIMTKLGLLPSPDAAKAEYSSYIRNGLFTQLTRVSLGKDIEQAHMRNRQLIASWCYTQGKDQNVIEIFSRNQKTYIRINDYERLRMLIGRLLKEVQRIKSEGDYLAGKALVERYGVKVNQQLHREVLDRYQKLNLAPYSGFINPELIPIESQGKITNVIIKYPDDYMSQMMEYSKKYSFLRV
jgi:dipeptidyl-peptidase III